MYKLVKALVKKPGGETWQKSLLIGYDTKHPERLVIKDENDKLEYEIKFDDIFELCDDPYWYYDGDYFVMTRESV